MPGTRVQAQRHQDLIRRLSLVDDAIVLDEVERLLDDYVEAERLLRLEDDAIDAVLRQLLEDDPQPA